MLAKIFLILGLSFAFALGEPDIELSKFSREVTTTGNETVIGLVGNRLYAVSLNETHIRINSTDKNWQNWSEKCTIAINAKQDHIEGEIQVAISRNVLAIWGIKTSEIVEKTRRTNYTFLLIKPLTCTYESLKLPVHEMPANYTFNLPAIVEFGYYGFNIFYSKECLPCYVRNGYTSESRELEIDVVEPSKPYLLSRARLVDGQVGYFYTFNFANGTAVAKLLTLSFETTQQILVDHLIEIADSDFNPFDDETYISFCYGNGTQQVFCGQFDDELKLRFHRQIALLPNHFASSFTIKVDVFGRSLVGLIQSPLDQENEPEKIYGYTFDKNGEVIKSIYLGEIEHKFEHNKLSDWIVIMNGRQYCIHVIQMEKSDNRNTSEVIKCIKYNPFETVDLSLEVL